LLDGCTLAKRIMLLLEIRLGVSFLFVCFHFGAKILHPSGPPSDALDHIADSAAEISQEFAAIKEKALKKWSTFFNKDEQQHSVRFFSLVVVVVC
jgi:hypothetical protein